MSVTKIAIDFGSSNTSIFIDGLGIVLKEPTLVAVTKLADGNPAVKCFGNEAKKILGKTDENTTIFSPVYEGKIKKIEYAKLLISYFLSKVMVVKPFTKIELLIPVSCGLTPKERNDFYEVFKTIKPKKIIIIPKALCSAVGICVPIDSSNSNIIVDLGGGTIEVCVVNLNSIVKGATTSMGGRVLDLAIMGQLKVINKILMGYTTAEKLKEEVMSLFPNDTRNLEISGIGDDTHSPKNMLVISQDLTEIAINFFEPIVEVVQTIINSCPPEVSADIMATGIKLCGGLSCLTGVENFFETKLGLNVELADEAENACIIGAGKLLCNNKQLTEIATQC
ncbi:MAG: rod shape-determining protein [Clostridia bacterium]